MRTMILQAGSDLRELHGKAQHFAIVRSFVRQGEGLERVSLIWIASPTNTGSIAQGYMHWNCLVLHETVHSTGWEDRENTRKPRGQSGTISTHLVRTKLDRRYPGMGKRTKGAHFRAKIHAKGHDKGNGVEIRRDRVVLVIAKAGQEFKPYIQSDSAAVVCSVSADLPITTWGHASQMLYLGGADRQTILGLPSGTLVCQDRLESSCPSRGVVKTCASTFLVMPKPAWPGSVDLSLMWSAPRRYRARAEPLTVAVFARRDFA
ncbi:hypothetical protein V8E52_004433 [Russula decolorans]